MNTNQNHQPTPSAIPQADAGTNQNQKYEITFNLVQYSCGQAFVEAATVEEARQKAEELLIEEILNWEIYDDVLNIEEIEAVDGGQGHE